MTCIRFLVGFIFFLQLFSCSQRSENSNLQIFRYNESSGIVSLDPAFAKDLPHIWVCNQLYNGLLALNEKMEVIPAIAKSWTISDDGKEYLFNLKTDIYFHGISGQKGRSVKASDFVFSFNRLIDPQLSSPGSWIMEQVERFPDGSLAIKALNDSTLQIRLKKSFPPFSGILSMSYASVVPQEAVDMLRNCPIGTGPFRFQYWKEGVKLVLLKNEHYFERSAEADVPKIDAVSISFLIDRQTAFMEFIKGNLDYMSGIDARYKDELLNRDGSLREKYIDRIHLIREPFMNTEYLGFFVEGAEASNEESIMFRKAINIGVDRDKMLRFLRNNIGVPGHGGMIPNGMPGYNSEIGFRYDLQEAIRIVDTYNFRGKELVISTTAEYVDLMKFIQSQLQDIGIKVLIEVLPAATLREMRAKGQLSVFRSSWVADYPDAENYLSLFLSKNKSPAGPNYTHFSNLTFDERYDEAMQMANLQDRVPVYQELDSMLMAEAPVMVLYYDEVLRFVGNNVAGMGSNPTNLLDLRYITITNQPD